ncbi:Macrophage-expressed gene 1 protein [Camelus dromedarius]|uniref:Macrophage-expressed gene 1 protein n=1 Tax=Camelus dromedarius TaxID=9838 RepID=A0A5N4DN68_CAMDR|nr:macrophage-expressed gene 1 protein-like [Camelus dromedarius]KAB1272509.1 Macrophage-expressed gene 1 protein [Camelus dromedarius]
MEELRGGRLPRQSSPPAMAQRLAPLLVLLLAGRGVLGEQGMADFQECKQKLNVSVLGALPGSGWDNLRNVELELVLKRDYSQCLTTEDGEYLIPDHTQVMPRRESIVETRAELIDHWVNYTDSWAASINNEVSFLSVLNGKFSFSCQKVKKYNLEHKTLTSRVEVRHNIYSVKASENTEFQPIFRQHLLTISDHLENNQTREAEYLAEMLVVRYGTHVLTKVEAGATLVQEDQLKRELVGSNTQDRINITFAASALFFKKVKVGTGVSWQAENQLLDNYLRHTVASETRSHGGVPFYPGITLEKWQKGISNRLVAIGKSGLPLPALIQPEALPELPAPAVRRLAAAVNSAIHRYYAINTHPGCMRLDSPDFDPGANVDDGSCSNRNHANFTFGGVFQECQPVSEPGAKSLCETYHIPNPLTGKTSCPANYTVSYLSTKLKTWSQVGPECRPQCHTCWFFFKCCPTVCANREHRHTVRLTASWCAPSRGLRLNTAGFLFGGLYSPGNPNPFTGSQICPSHFYPQTLFGDLKVCVSTDSELGSAQAVPFGGFFSCQAGNPLAGFTKGQSPGILKEVFYQDSSTKYPMKCPEGYSQHQAYLSEGCQVLYCLKAGILLDQQMAGVRLPPFIPRPPWLNNSRAQRLSVLIDSSRQLFWVKQKGSDRWQPASINDPSLLVKLLSQADSGRSVSATIGSWMGAIVAVVVLALGANYAFRYYKKGGFKRSQKDIGAEEQKAYGATETPTGPGSVFCKENGKDSV